MIKWFLNSKLGEWYLLFLMWLEERKLTKQRRNFKHIKPGMVIVKKQELLIEGVKQIKQRINSIVKIKTKEEYDAILQSIQDLSQFANCELNSQHANQINALHRAWVYQHCDIKSELDRMLMVEKRIKDYAQLHKHIEQRQKLRQARKNKHGNV